MKMDGTVVNWPSLKIYDFRCGRQHAILRDRSGELYGYGDNNFGQLGLPKETSHCDKPTKIYAFERSVTIQYSCGAYHSVVQNDHGRVYVFGRNNKNQLGFDNQHDSVFFPVCHHKLKPFNNIVSVTCSSNTTYVMTKENKVFAFGNNSHGQCGASPEKFLFTSDLSQIVLVQ